MSELLKKGARGISVRKLQKLLNQALIYLTPIPLLLTGQTHSGFRIFTSCAVGLEGLTEGLLRILLFGGVIP